MDTIRTLAAYLIIALMAGTQQPAVLSPSPADNQSVGIPIAFTPETSPSPEELTFAPMVDETTSTPNQSTGTPIAFTPESSPSPVELTFAPMVDETTSTPNQSTGIPIAFTPESSPSPVELTFAPMVEETTSTPEAATPASETNTATPAVLVDTSDEATAGETPLPDDEVPTSSESTGVPFLPEILLRASGEVDASSADGTATEPTPLATTTIMPGGMTRTLVRSMEGDDVSTLQQRLQDLGYLGGNVDGIFGKETKKAVTDFQAAHDLESDGLAGLKTLTILFSDDAKAVPGTTPRPTPSPTPTPTAEPTPTPIPTPTPVPTAPVPLSWKSANADQVSPLQAAEGISLVLTGTDLDEKVYTDSDKNLYLPLRAIVHASKWIEDILQDGSAYEFTTNSWDSRKVALGCATDDQGIVSQPMIMIDGLLYVDESYKFIRWGEEIYVPVDMWNKVVKSPALTQTDTLITIG